MFVLQAEQEGTEGESRDARRRRRGRELSVSLGSLLPVGGPVLLSQHLMHPGIFCPREEARDKIENTKLASTVLFLGCGFPWGSHLLEVLVRAALSLHVNESTCKPGSNSVGIQSSREKQSMDGVIQGSPFLGDAVGAMGTEGTEGKDLADI